MIPAVDVNLLLQVMLRSGGSIPSKATSLYCLYISCVNTVLSSISLLDFVFGLNLTSFSITIFVLVSELATLIEDCRPKVRFFLISLGITMPPRGLITFGSKIILWSTELIFLVQIVVLSPRVCHEYFLASNCAVDFKLINIRSSVCHTRRSRRSHSTQIHFG